jgi:hypothetical protein
METKSQKLTTLKQKQIQIKAQIQLLEAAEKTRDKKRDLRRKILIGTYFLNKAISEDNLDKLYQQMHSHLDKKSDRELFKL